MPCLPLWLGPARACEQNGTTSAGSHPRAWFAIAVEAIGAGAMLWVVGNVVQLGGYRAVGLMATHRNPPATVGSIHFTDLIDDAFELASFALLEVGMFAFAWIGT
jgi:hypothetical protein